MTKMIDAQQRKTIFGLGKGLGISEPGNQEDGLHLLVAGVTGKESIKELTYRQAADVIQELKKRGSGTYARKPGKQKEMPGVPGMMTPGQKRKAWALMYSLAELDREPGGASLGERLCAVIRKEQGLDCTPSDPFRFLDYKAGNHLVEVLKGYVKSGRRKAGGGDGLAG